jgi:hypothetical protein
MVNFVRGGVRLYDHPQIVKRTPTGHLDADEGGAPAADVPSNRSDTYLTAVLKLIPAEVVTVYMAIRDSATQHGKLTLWFILCLVTCFIFRSYASLPRNTKSGLPDFRDAQWIGVVVAVIAFYLWAYATGAGPELPSFLGFLQIDSWLASALAALLGILAPLIVPGDPDTKDGG